MLSIKAFINNEINNYDNKLWEYIKNNYNNINEKNEYIYEINYLIKRGLLELSPITNNLSEIFENDYIIIYSYDNDYYLNEGKGEFIRKGIAAVGKIIGKNRNSLNTSKIGRKINLTHGGVKVHNAAEKLKDGAKEIINNPIRSARRAAYDAVGVGVNAAVDPNPIRPYKNIKDIDKVSNFLVNTPNGREVEKQAYKQGWKGLKKGVSNIIKHPIENAKKLKAASIKAKPHIKTALNKTKEIIKKHPIETAAHIVTQTANSTVPVPRLATAWATHSSAAYARKNKGHLVNSTIKDTKEVIKSTKNVVKKQGSQALSHEIPDTLLNRSKLSKTELLARDNKIRNNNNLKLAKERKSRAKSTAKKMSAKTRQRSVSHSEPTSNLS